MNNVEWIIADVASEGLNLGRAPYFALGFYLLLLLVLGVVGYLRSKQSEDDYYLAGRQQGWIVSGLTIIATFFSSFAMLGAPGLVYRQGVVFVLFALNVPLSAATVYLLGGPIRRIGQAKGYVTPADMVSDHYGSPVALRLLVALAGYLYAVPYVMMQIKAGGDLSAVLFPNANLTLGSIGTFDAFQIGAVLLALITMLYIMIGGMRSVAWTDVLQGVLLMGGMLLGGAAMVASFGSVGKFGEAISKLPETSLTAPGTTGAFPWITMFTVCLFASTGSLVQPAQWMRYYSASSSETLRRGAVMFAVLLPPCFLFGVMLVGLGGQVLYPLQGTGVDAIPAAEVGAFDRILVVALRDQLPELFGEQLGIALASIVIVAIMAASMSTADSNLHAMSAVTVRDIYDRFIRPTASEKERVWVGRIVIVLITLAALWMVLGGTFGDDRSESAFDFMRMIALMGLSAIAFSAQLLPLTVDMLYLKRGTRTGAIWGLAVGLIAAFVFGRLFGPFAEMLELVPGGSSFIAMLDACKTALPMDSTAWGLLFNVPVFTLVSFAGKRRT